MIVIPHADDDLIGCFCVINGFNKVYAYYIGDYPIKNDELTKKRDRELKSFSELYGLKLVDKMNTEHSANIRAAILKHEIGYVVTPDFNDWHPDHQQASKYVIDALAELENKPTILTYCVTVPKPFLRETLYVPMSKKLQRLKWDTFRKIYKSQRFMPVERFMFQERLNAIGIDNTYAAELFSPLSYEQLCKEYNSRPSPATMESVKHMIYNICKIRKYSDSFGDENTIRNI